MKIHAWGLRLLCGMLAWAVLSPASAYRYDESRYNYCRTQAERISGYYGPVPDRYLPGGAGRGLARGAVAGVTIGAITGGNTKKAARRGAITGAVVGAAKRERARDQQRDRRYVYDVEFDRCLNHYR